MNFVPELSQRVNTRSVLSRGHAAAKVKYGCKTTFWRCLHAANSSDFILSSASCDRSLGIADHTCLPGNVVCKRLDAEASRSTFTAALILQARLLLNKVSRTVGNFINGSDPSRLVRRLTSILVLSTVTLAQSAWQKQEPIPTPWYFYDVDMISASEGWSVSHPITGDHATIFHTINGGRTWKRQGPFFRQLNGIAFIDALH